MSQTQRPGCPWENPNTVVCLSELKIQLLLNRILMLALLMLKSSTCLKYLVFHSALSLFPNTSYCFLGFNYVVVLPAVTVARIPPQPGSPLK